MNTEQIAKELSLLTGKEWEKIKENQYHYGIHGEIGLKNSLAHICLNSNDQQKKIKIFGGFQIKAAYGTENLSHNKINPINVAITKSSAQIAKDINRRLLEHYLAEFEKAIANHNQWEVKRLERLETIKTLAKIAGLNPKLEAHTDRIYGYGKVSEILVCSKIDLKLSVTEAEAIKILELIA